MDTIIIKSDRLLIELSYPGKIYKGSRFDWTGFITNITLDGKHTFCVDESLITGVGTGGRGLCNEFGIHEPIGHDEIRLGQCFPKLGIGLLKKKDLGEYRFWEPYEISEFNIETICEPNRVSFLVNPKYCNGYAAILKKIITVEENNMTVNYSLENTGEKIINTTEYIHNFVGIDRNGIGPQNELSFSFDLKGENVPKIFKVRGNMIGWEAVPNEEFYWAPKGYEKQKTCWWKLVDNISGVGLKEYCNFEAHRVAIWGKGHVVSPEVFIDISLKPGEVKKWARTYEFFEL